MYSAAFDQQALSVSMYSAIPARGRLAQADGLLPTGGPS